MKLFGTTTSPFVRRVRVIADETGQVIELVNTAPDAGQARLREVSPIRKVPVALVDGRTIYDSHIIIDWILTTRGWHQLSPPRDPWLQHNIINAIDGALDAAIQLFYLRRDGVAVDGTAYATRQIERVDAIFTWLATQVEGGRSFTACGGGFGLAELALVTTLDWMDFRQAYPTERHEALNAVRATWRERASLAATRPHA
jgi:glutathione S-transferase